MRRHLSRGVQWTPHHRHVLVSRMCRGDKLYVIRGGILIVCDEVSDVFDETNEPSEICERTEQINICEPI